ncbi:M23 family metallopeptidase [Azospirillum sp. BE72]|uniref:M23 family metallopeptidase n=1 Tax=Azospirillum sp. BE72 TaxID=2817776 RepID=UPI002855E4FC|nr:M23 family metallopeptidase [Azospirillum sp. BE72]MDR6774163.1 murein DD-endopeptidase MepM/ murein hydrolase activator NlpD [Azospirillum sp. BE72]
MRVPVRYRWGFAALLFLPSAAAAQPPAAQLSAGAPALELPVRCRIGADCFVQNYVDADPGPGMRDFACGRLTYDGHKGTDFRLPDLEAMRRGVAVVAAASGTVARVRDGMEDVSIRQSGGAPAGYDAGNAVVVDHGDGWETQYSHLKRGSVIVKPGDRVEAGTPLGQIGLSGKTEFPHVDFGIRHDGRTLDPYTGKEAGSGDAPSCAADQGAAGTGNAPLPPDTLWSAEARRTLAYRPSALLGAGLAPEAPKAEVARDGGYGAGNDGKPLPAGTPTLGVWAELMGGRQGDRVTLEVTGPDGRRLFRSEGAVPRPLAVLFFGTEVKKPAPGPWAPGPYRVTVTLRHGDETVLREERRVEVR